MSVLDFFKRTVHTSRLDSQDAQDFVSDELLISDSDSRQALEDVAWMTAGLFSDGNSLAQLYIDDGWDVNTGARNGLTDQQRDELLARLENLAHNTGQLVAELRRRASAVSRATGWDPLVTEKPD